MQFDAAFMTCQASKAANSGEVHASALWSEGAASQVLIGSEYGIVGPSYAHGDAKDRRAERQMFATGHV